MSEPAAALPSAAQRSRDRSLVDAIWSAFASLRLALWLISLLACAGVLGTFVNQANRTAGELRGTMGHEWWYPAYRFFELDALFRSWWFVLLLLLLALNLTASAIERLPRVFADALRPEKRLAGSQLDGLKTVRLKTRSPPGKTAAEVAALLRARGFKTEVYAEEAAGPAWVFAEKGRISRFGAAIVHLGLLLILGGALLGRLFGVDGVVSVPMDGGTFDSMVRRTADGSPYKSPLGFTVRVDAFRLLKYGNGSPRAFESDLDVLDGFGNPLRHKTIRVGEPLSWAGWTFYQASFEEEPSHDQVKLNITDLAAGGTGKTYLLGKDGEAKLPDGVRFQVTNYTADFQHLGPAVQLERRAPGGGKTSFWVFGKYPEFDAKNRGDKYGLRFDGVEPFYFTGLAIARDPGYPLWLTGCCVLLLGLAAAYYRSHRRVWVRASPDGELVLAGAAHRNPAAFEESFAELIAAVQKAKV